MIRNTVTTQAIELVGCYTGSYIFERFGFYKTNIFLFGSSAVSLLFMILFKHDKNLTTLFITLTKFGIGATFNLVYVYIVKYMPTIVSGSAFGIISCIGRGCAMASSHVAELTFPLPSLILMIVTLVAAAITPLFVTDLPHFI